MIVEVGGVGHGGICVAHAPDGRVVFVRHAIPGERVRVAITDERSSYLRADAVEVLAAAPTRVQPPCPWAGPGRCGGCDWQHVALSEQRRMKATVVSEQLRRLAHVRQDVVVEAVPGDREGLGWRTRVRFAVDAGGRAGLHRHRSHEVEPIDDCLIAHPAVRADEVLAQPWRGVESVDVETTSTGERVLSTTPPGPAAAATLSPTAFGRPWTVPAGGFWQVHPGAADALVDAVVQLAGPRAGDRCLDLYAGVGLFAHALALGAGADNVVAVESDQRAVAAAAENVPGVEVVCSRVERWLSRTRGPADVVVLDPPRRGAGRAVTEAIARRHPRAVAYVACDPAALARDVATFASSGYRLTGLRGFDIFPMTAHIECVALLEPQP